jgi:hypothetical protein
VTYWTLNLWKAYLHSTRLSPVPVSPLRKAAHHFFPQAGLKAASVNLQTQQVSATHHMWLPPPTWNTIQSSFWADWTPTLNKTEKHKQWSATESRGGWNAELT